MGVQILILSGGNGSRRRWFDNHRILIGDSPESDVRFDADQSPGAQGKRLLLFLDTEGWQVLNEGTTAVLVNQTLHGRSELLKVWRERTSRLRRPPEIPAKVCALRPRCIRASRLSAPRSEMGQGCT